MPNVAITKTANEAFEKAKKILKENGFERTKTSLIEQAAKDLLKQLSNDYNCHDEQDILRLVYDAIDELEQPTLIRIQRYLQNRQGIRFANQRVLLNILNNNLERYRIGTNTFYIKKERKNVEQNIN
ncbi:hypothetical protein [uncultured Mediterranean phage uvMED]|nr:hypothetical protein [uncultured Mediterranean phage uvMED]